MVSKVQESGGQAHHGSRQLVGGNYAPGSKQMDSGGMAQGLQVLNPWQKDGDTRGEVRRG